MNRCARFAISSVLVAGALAPATAVFGQDRTPLTVKPPASFTSLQRDADLAAARTLFEANLDAIRNQDRDAYLACYWQNPAFTMNGPGGPSTGYADFAANVGEAWPEVFDASHMEFTWLRPGVVYGSYRYRVAFDGNESTGRSERVLMETDAGWRIAVSTAFPDPPGTLPPPVALVGCILLPDSTGAPLRGAVVVVREGKIECAGIRCQIPGDAERVVVLNQWVVMGEVEGDPFREGSAEEAAPSPGGAAPGGSAPGGAAPGNNPRELTVRLGIPIEAEPANLLILERDPRLAAVSSGPAFANVRMVVRGGEVRDATEYQKSTGANK